MEKQKRWQFYLIVAVIALTIYNILPTIFFYSKPLNQPVDVPRAETIAHQIVDRVNDLEDDSKEWLWSFAKLLNIKPSSVEIQANDPRLIEITFKNQHDVNLFKRFLPKAGMLISFVPSQLELYTDKTNADPLKVLVARQIGVRLNAKDVQNMFHFAPRLDENGNISTLYKDITYDRATQIALGFGAPTSASLQLKLIAGSENETQDSIISFAKDVVESEKVASKNPELQKRYYSSFTQIDLPNKDELIQKYLSRSEKLLSSLETEKQALLAEQTKAKEAQNFLDSAKQQRLTLLQNEQQTLKAANVIIQKNLAQFKNGKNPLTLSEIQNELAKSDVATPGKIQTVSLNGKNPFVEALLIDWNSDRIELKFFDDIQALRMSDGKGEAENILKEKLNQLMINDIARASRFADEEFIPHSETFAVTLNKLSDTTGFLTFDTGYLAKLQSDQLVSELKNSWNPTHIDLKAENFPISDFDSFSKLKEEDQKLGAVIYAPAMEKQAAPAGFQKGSIYVIAKGMDTIHQKLRQSPNTPEAQELLSNIEQLNQIMEQNGFIGYPGSSYGLAKEFNKDYIYEKAGFYTNLLKATREDFSVKGSKRFAVLDFSNVEQRILTLNKIDDRIQEDLLKWKEEYNAAQVSRDITKRYEVPAPTKNAYVQNFLLSTHKYFRGDDRKILKWGLDLSGGKTVRIGLKDHNGKTVTNPDDLNQAVNELYTRINKMGVSERAIHIESNNIILDFPGSQNMSASDLIKASAMYFHIVNEKFGPSNADLSRATNAFLQDVWNEAVVTNRKDIDSINVIAWNHLGGDATEIQGAHPRSENAQVLFDQGLRLANPNNKNVSSTFDDTLSTIGMIRGDDSAEWNNQTNPLMVLFHNFALEGASLTNVQVGYDPSEGNTLSFNVKKSYEGSSEKDSGSPRDALYAWTSQFSQDKISGTPREHYSAGHGWRMAVVLNGTVITQPTLRAALKDGGSISGRFSQREITQLAADLKAGSLSFTPKILSEENVSPELGKEERVKGVVASIIALTLVVVAMVGYYRFAGVVASCAVLFNILIMWGILQNLDAALTLPGIAGIVLTIGMAVDANVLVFERIREEFKISGRIGSAIAAGYRKAFSAIIDSNVTTIIAALILIQFDSGPIKGFAVTLIIGIVSSMFTALFMTRYFFAGWVQNPKNKSLEMSQFIGKTHFDFLKQTKKALMISAVMLVAGTFLFFSQGKSMLGMDFTGGYSLNVELNEKATDTNYRLQTIDALLAKGATSNDFQVRELSRPNQLRIQLGTSMEEKGHPFYQMPEVEQEGKYAFSYESNPRIVWLVNALEEANLQVVPNQLNNLDTNWSVISGQFSDAMRNNAIIGLGLALLMILVYITFRFEFKFAMAAVIGLIYDIIITMGILALFHLMGLPVQIDLQVIGAIMTIIGYSLNDTIIVFDRIREDMHVLRKLSFKDIINHALNVTLSRTLMTSGTTLLVLLALVFLGGPSIFAFALVMTLGVIVGTLSTLFIATPALLYLHNKEIAEENGLKAKRT
jgi:SecD/SecF fusion protein